MASKSKKASENEKILFLLPSGQKSTNFKNLNLIFIIQQQKLTNETENKLSNK
jgi:hypothetical protein